MGVNRNIHIQARFLYFMKKYYPLFTLQISLHSFYLLHSKGDKRFLTKKKRGSFSNVPNRRQSRGLQFVERESVRGGAPTSKTLLSVLYNHFKETSPVFKEQNKNLQHSHLAFK